MPLSVPVPMRQSVKKHKKKDAVNMVLMDGFGFGRDVMKEE